MADLQLLLRWQPGSTTIHAVCTVPGDDNSWDVIFDGPLQRSNVPSVLAWWVRIWCTLEEGATST